MAVLDERQQKGIDALLNSPLFINSQTDKKVKEYIDNVKVEVDPQIPYQYNPNALVKGDSDPDLGENYDYAKAILRDRYFDLVDIKKGNFSDIRDEMGKIAAEFIKDNVEVYCAPRSITRLVNDALFDIAYYGRTDAHEFPDQREAINLETASVDKLKALVEERRDGVDEITLAAFDAANMAMTEVQAAPQSAVQTATVENNTNEEVLAKATDEVKKASKAVILEADYKHWLDKANNDDFKSHYSYVRDIEQLATHIRGLSQDAYSDLSEQAQNYLRRACQSRDVEENKGNYPREVKAIVHDIVYNGANLASMFGGNYQNEELKALSEEVKRVTDVAPKALYKALPFQGITNEYSSIDVLKSEMGSKVPALSEIFRAKSVELLQTYANHLTFQCGDNRRLDTVGEFLQKNDDNKIREFNGDGQFAMIYSALAHYDNGINIMGYMNPLDKRLSDTVRDIVEKEYFADARLNGEVLAKNREMVIEQSAACFEASVIHCQKHENLISATKFKNEVMEKTADFVNEYINDKKALYENRNVGNNERTYTADLEALEDKLGQQIKSIACEPRDAKEERWFMAVSEYMSYRLDINRKQMEGRDVKADEIKSFRAFVQENITYSGDIMHDLDKYLGHRANMEVSLGVDEILDRVNDAYRVLEEHGVKDMDNLENMVALPLVNSLARSCAAIVEMNEAAKTYQDEREKLDLLAKVAKDYIDRPTEPVFDDPKMVQALTVEEVRQAIATQEKIEKEMSQKKTLFPTFRKAMANIQNFFSEKSEAIADRKDERETQRFFKHCVDDAAKCDDVAYCTVYAGTNDNLYDDKLNTNSSDAVFYRPQEGDTAKLVYTLKNNSELILDKNGGMVYYDALRGSTQIESIAELRDVLRTAEGHTVNLSLEFETALEKVLSNEDSQRRIDLKTTPTNKPVNRNAVLSQLAQKGENPFEMRRQAAEARREADTNTRTENKPKPKNNPYVRD